MGYACGPIIFAPMSELYGRRVPIIIAAFAFGLYLRNNEALTSH